MKETLRRRITVTSSLSEISTDQLGKMSGGEGRRCYSAHPTLYNTLLDRYLQTTCTGFPSTSEFASWVKVWSCREGVHGLSERARILRDFVCAEKVPFQPESRFFSPKSSLSGPKGRFPLNVHTFFLESASGRI
jgi:hypothetical protein